jgi:DNA-binding IclR family transcriptional regulator
MMGGLTTPTAPKAAAEPRHIQSIPLGFRLVHAIEAASGPLSLKEIAAAVDMDPGHAHLYLASLKMVGLVQQAGSGGAYTLGPYAIQLGLSALRKLDLTDAAREHLLRLQHETGLTAYLSVWGNFGPTIALKVDGNLPSPMTIRLGYVLPMLSTATGRVFLTYLPRTDTAPTVEREVQSLRGAKPDASAAALDKLCAQVRRRGVAAAESPINAGFVGMAAPVFDHQGSLCAALAMLGPAGAVDASLDGPMAQALKSRAEELSAQLGFDAPNAVNGKAPPAAQRRKGKPS